MKLFHLGFASHSGIRNMAVDETLLETVRRLGVPVYRIYAWNEPTLSLGYFQRYEDRHLHPASIDCPAVRRLTGGGAIVHDRELTYCLAVPPRHELATEHRLRLYETIHRAAIGVLSEWGLETFLAGDIDELSREKPDKNTFLCFQRIAPGDGVAWSEKFGWVKLLGSAQYRDKHGGVLQHGSLLWERSRAAPELPGLKEVWQEKLLSDPPLRSSQDGGFEGLDKRRMFLSFCDRFSLRLSAKLKALLDLQWQNLGEEDMKEMESSIAILQKKRYSDRWMKKK